ncbi:amino acid transmembrane transporter [Aureococcus anophagefferens]|uniref:Amino acid transmembrane transporter n=2 Tax=Aureococcus anophagefferens TaxID=44056 RepID=A0ABR1GF44_AURAN
MAATEAGDSASAHSRPRVMSWTEKADAASDLTVWSHKRTGELRFVSPYSDDAALLDDDLFLNTDWLLDVSDDDGTISSKASGEVSNLSSSSKTVSDLSSSSKTVSADDALPDDAELPADVSGAIAAFQRFEHGEGRFSLEEAFKILELVHQRDRRVLDKVEVRPTASPVRDLGAHAYLMARSGKRGRTCGAEVSGFAVTFQSVHNSELWFPTDGGDVGVASRPMARSARRAKGGEHGGGVSHGYRGRMYTLVERVEAGSKRVRVVDDSLGLIRAASLTAALRASGSRLSVFVGKPDHKVPDAYTCPITRELMREPVVCADGHTYEKAAIEAWFLEDKSTSPKTGLALDSKHLVPNFAIRSAIDELREPRSPPPPPPADDLVDDGELWPFDALPDYAGMWP